MRSVDTDVLIEQAKDFYRNTKYVPSNYDFLFHTASFSSPVTIRKRFGSWSKYVERAIEGTFMEFPDRMFYGGYGQLYTPHIPSVPDPYIYDKQIFWNDIEYDEPLSAKALYVTKLRAKDVYDALYEMYGHNPRNTIEPLLTTKTLLIPSFIVNTEYLVASFDTPHYLGHFKRCEKFMNNYGNKYEIINVNGVKKNHLKNYIGDMIE